MLQTLNSHNFLNEWNGDDEYGDRMPFYTFVEAKEFRSYIIVRRYSGRAIHELPLQFNNFNFFFCQIVQFINQLANFLF